MSLFGNLSDDNLEEVQDVVGGGFSPIKSDIYVATIKAAYAGKSRTSDAQNVSLILDVNGQEHRETLYITNKNKQNFYTKNGKNYPLPGYTTINDICLIAAETPLKEMQGEDKIIKRVEYIN